jgi:uroporphyrinogen decarboxylase
MGLRFNEYEGKPDRDRLIRAVLGREVDRVPNFEILIEDKIVEKILGRHINGSAIGTLGNYLEVEDTLVKAEEYHKDIEFNIKDRPIYAGDYIKLCEAIGQDAIGLEVGPAPFLKKSPDGKKVFAGDRSYKNRTDIEKNLIMPTENMDHFKWRLPYLKEYRSEAVKKNIGVILFCEGHFHQLYGSIFGIENFSLLLHDDPLLIEELIEDGIEYWVNFSKYILKEDFDIVYFADDLAFKGGLFIDYKTLKKIYLDKFKKVLEPFASAGIPIIFHSDGTIYEILDELLDMGVNCLNPIEPYGMDYRIIKKRYGRDLTIMGNIDISLLSNGTPEEIKKDIKNHMDICKPGYRYICATSHSLRNDVQDENVIAFFDSIHRLGLY